MKCVVGDPLAATLVWQSHVIHGSIYWKQYECSALLIVASGLSNTSYVRKSPALFSFSQTLDFAKFSRHLSPVDPSPAFPVYSERFISLQGLQTVRVYHHLTSRLLWNTTNNINTNNGIIRIKILGGARFLRSRQALVRWYQGKQLWLFSKNVCAVVGKCVPVYFSRLKCLYCENKFKINLSSVEESNRKDCIISAKMG